MMHLMLGFLARHRVIFGFQTGLFPKKKKKRKEGEGGWGLTFFNPPWDF